MANALPILLIGGAALLMMGGKKKTTTRTPEGPGGADPRWKACEDGGGKMEIINDRGVCILPDGNQVDGWKLLRGELHSGETVVVYSAEWCNACTSLKKDLLDAGIPFTERDIEADDEAAEFVKSNGGAIPISTVGGEMFVGGDKLGEIQSAR